ncbi:MAG: hypothetical protein M1813_006173 [Trichoglossum hirsutum]|nr:MAG: hypothetical protein M1813_006173 [Trichoglossum hirsutum]
MGFWIKVKICAHWIGGKLSLKTEEGSVSQSLHDTASEILGIHDGGVNTDGDTQPPATSSQGDKVADAEKRGLIPSKSDSGPLHTEEEDSTFSNTNSTHEDSTELASQVMGQGVVSELAQPVALAVEGTVESGVESMQQSRAESYIKNASDLDGHLKPEEVRVQGRKEVELRVELVEELRRRRTIVE